MITVIIKGMDDTSSEHTLSETLSNYSQEDDSKDDDRDLVPFNNDKIEELNAIHVIKKSEITNTIKKPSEVMMQKKIIAPKANKVEVTKKKTANSNNKGPSKKNNKKPVKKNTGKNIKNTSKKKPVKKNKGRNIKNISTKKPVAKKNTSKQKTKKNK